MLRYTSGFFHGHRYCVSCICLCVCGYRHVSQTITEEQTGKMLIRCYSRGKTPNAHTWHLRAVFSQLVTKTASSSSFWAHSWNLAGIYFPASIAVPARGIWAEIIYDAFRPGPNKCPMVIILSADANKRGHLPRRTLKMVEAQDRPCLSESLGRDCWPAQ